MPSDRTNFWAGEGKGVDSGARWLMAMPSVLMWHLEQDSAVCGSVPIGVGMSLVCSGVVLSNAEASDAAPDRLRFGQTVLW